MIKAQIFWDKTAIGLSMLCALHCLALPLFLVVFPSLAALHLDNEAFHFWMVIAVLPTSLYALTLGCKKHKRKQFLVVGSIGVTFLLFAILLHEPLLGELGEKIFTLIGAGLLAYSHVRNHQLCRRSQKTCACPEHQAAKDTDVVTL